MITPGTKNEAVRKHMRTAAITVSALAILATSWVVYKTAEDISRRSVVLETTISADASKVQDMYNTALENNKEYLNKIDNRNNIVSEQVVDYGTKTSTLVSAIDIDEAPVIYTEENSSTTVINGIENLETKYAPYLYYYGQRNDLNASLLYTLETECSKYGLDPYVMLGVIMTESGGNANTKSSASTATGMCQILRGTGKYIYEDLMGHGKGTYNHSMAYNPDLNIRMGITYLGTLNQRYGLHGAIRKYRGLEDNAYYRSINKYMALSGRSLPF